MTDGKTKEPKDAVKCKNTKTMLAFFAHMQDLFNIVHRSLNLFDLISVIFRTKRVKQNNNNWVDMAEHLSRIRHFT